MTSVNSVLNKRYGQQTKLLGDRSYKLCKTSGFCAYILYCALFTEVMFIFLKSAKKIGILYTGTQLVLFEENIV